MEGECGARNLHPLADLARRAVEAYVRERRVLSPEPLSGDLPCRAGVFVTLREDGCLRGCVGTIEPATESLAEEVIRSALMAANDDPRFDPVEADELPQLAYEVSVLGEPERVEGPNELDPHTYGVIVVAGRRRGLLLPDIPGLNSVADQLRVARQKAGIGIAKRADLYRFRTLHYG